MYSYREGILCWACYLSKVQYIILMAASLACFQGKSRVLAAVAIDHEVRERRRKDTSTCTSSTYICCGSLALRVQVSAPKSGADDEPAYRNTPAPQDITKAVPRNLNRTLIPHICTVAVTINLPNTSWLLCTVGEGKKDSTHLDGGHRRRDR